MVIKLYVFVELFKCSCISGGFDFPKGHSVILYQYGCNQDPEYFSNPEKFDPERFRPDAPRQWNNFTYFPFSAGPRNCIGEFDPSITNVKIFLYVVFFINFYYFYISISGNF